MRRSVACEARHAGIRRQLTADVTDVITHRGLRITIAVEEGLERGMMASKRLAGGNGNQSNLQLVIAFDCGGRRLHPR